MPYVVLLHSIFISAWVGGLLLLCSLCAEQATPHETGDEHLIRFSLGLFAWVATLSGVLAVLSGTWLAYVRGFDGGWLPVKLGFVIMLTWLHVYTGRLVAQLRDGKIYRRAHYLVVGCGSVLVSLPILYLVLGKPF